MNVARIAASVVMCGVIATAARAVNPPGAPDDHFLCYKIKAQTPFTPATGVSLSDAFQTTATNYDVTKPVSLCTPANNNNEGIVDAATHGENFKLKASSGTPKFVAQTHIRVANHFGELTVDVIKPELLLVPTAKDLGSSPPPPNSMAHNVDNYKCYKAKVSKGTTPFPKFTQASIADQFTTGKIFDVKKLKHLCAPVNDNGSGIKNPAGFLMCYQVKPAKGQPKHSGVTAFVNNQFGPETLLTVKETELCVPSITNPVCGDGAKDQSSEQCDGADDSACPGQCTHLCACRQQYPFTLDPNNSQIVVRGISTTGPGLDNTFTLSGIDGSLTINVDGVIKPGQYEISVPVTTFPPHHIVVPPFGEVATACVSLLEDPAMPGSGLAGIGILNCFGTPVDGLPSSSFSVYQDHCTNSILCDSGSPAQCTGALGNGGKIHADTGICVPAGPNDLTCMLTDPIPGTNVVSSASLEGASDPHPGVCNSPTRLRFGVGWQPGDAAIFIDAAIAILGPGVTDCSGQPPTASIEHAPLTTGTAVSATMDAFPDTAPAAGKVQALQVSGVQFDCSAMPAQLGVSGATFVTGAGALDIDLSLQPPFSGTADINAGLILKAQ